MEVIMHNLISYNQLAAWKVLETTLDEFVDQHEIMNSYFECLTECEEDGQVCKRHCRQLLTTL